MRLAIAPINWTNDDIDYLGDDISFEQCISEMALAGYEGCEVGRKFPVEQVDLLQYHLQLRKLQICNQWHSLFLTSLSLQENVKSLHQRCKFLEKMGAKVIGVSEQSGSIQARGKSLFSNQRPQLEEEQWKKLCSGCEHLGKIAWQEYGIQLCYHTHMGTVIETAAETEKLLNSTDQRYVHLLYDCGHLLVAGEEPLQVLQRHIQRVKHVHLKSVRLAVLEKAKQKEWSFLQAVRAGLFTVPGDGDLQTAPLLHLLAQHGYTDWLVVEAEQDPSIANPLEYALKAKEFITTELQSFKINKV